MIPKSKVPVRRGDGRPRWSDDPRKLRKWVRIARKYVGGVIPIARIAREEGVTERHVHRVSHKVLASDLCEARELRAAMATN